MFLREGQDDLTVAGLRSNMKAAYSRLNIHFYHVSSFFRQMFLDLQSTRPVTDRMAALRADDRGLFDQIEDMRATRFSDDAITDELKTTFNDLYLANRRFDKNHLTDLQLRSFLPLSCLVTARNILQEQVDAIYSSYKAGVVLTASNKQTVMSHLYMSLMTYVPPLRDDYFHCGFA